MSNPFQRKPFLTQDFLLRNLLTLQMPELCSMVKNRLVAKYQIPVAITRRIIWALSCCFCPQAVVRPVTAKKRPYHHQGPAPRPFNEKHVEEIVTLSKVVWPFFAKVSYYAQDKCSNLKKEWGKFYRKIIIKICELEISTRIRGVKILLGRVIKNFYCISRNFFYIFGW